VKVGPTAVAILVLSLAAWAYFFMKGLPLDLASTTIVVGAITLIVTLVSLLIRKFRKPPEAQPK
jgi:O-antigen/teichoic acid export membrane protein